jgi:hypothetical protein
MQFITLMDYLLLPIYLVVIFIIANNFKNSHYPPGHPWRKYFMPALSVKVIGAIFIGMVFQYYYGGGDTSYYFYQSKIVNEAISDNPFQGFQLMFHIPKAYEGDFQMYISRMEWYAGLNTFIVIGLSSFINFFTFSTFLPTSIIFACISFTGVWALFRTFAKQYPTYLRQVAIALLFIPSCFIWGSGIFKDTLCMFSLGWLTYCVFQILVERKFSILNFIYVFLSFYIIAIVKVYILIAFIPAVSLWILLIYSKQIRSLAIRIGMKIALFFILALSLSVLSETYAEDLGRYSLDNIAKTAEVTRSYILGESGKNDGSAYDLGEIDPSPLGLIKVFPKALVAALYGPFLWESKKIIILLNALEASLFLFLTIRILFRIGFKKFFKVIQEDPNIQFFIVFTLIFGFAVGLTSGNYGALSRYRIPCLPMFGLALLLIYYKSDVQKKPLFPFLGI